MAPALPPRICLSDMSAALYPVPEDGTAYEWVIRVSDPAMWLHLASSTAPGEEIPVLLDGREYTGTVFGLDWDTQVVRVIV
jgi:hypothetical protein